MTDLVDWLKDQIAEDEQLARWAAEQVGDATWQQRGTRIVTVADRDREVADYAIVECIDHIARHDPARVLAEVAAKRQILELHSIAHECTVYERDDVDRYHYVMDGEDCSTVRLLALPYAGNPGYDESWRP